MFDKIKNWISHFISTMTVRDIIYIVVIIILFGITSSAMSTCSRNNDKYDANIRALTDSVTYYKAKDNLEVAVKYAFVTQANELKTLNSELYDKIQALDVKPKTITNTVYLKGETQFLPQDTAYIVKHDTIRNGFSKSFNFNNQWRDLEGLVIYKPDSLKVKLEKDIVRFDYTVAMDKDNKIYIKSSNPYVKTTEISGFQVPTVKKTRWAVGPQIGVGYDPVHNKVAPTIGIGLTYGIYTW